MEPTISCANHAALVESYYLGHLCLREDSLQIAPSTFLRPRNVRTSAEASAATTRQERKRETAARRRAERLKTLTAQGKFVPLNARVRDALQKAYECFGGPRFKLRHFLPSFERSAETGVLLANALDSLPKVSENEALDDGSVHRNETDHLQVATVNGAKVVLPAGSTFAQRDVRELYQLSLGSHKLIVIDPPWQNKSVSRGKQYEMLDHTELLNIDVLHIADLNECILAVWVTNRPRYMTFLREQALPLWGFTFHACWYWLKLSKSGELVTPLDSTHRLPVETLVVAYRAKDCKHEQLLRQRLGEQMRIVLSVPLRHSWKPPPECFFDKDVVPISDRKAELFARELRPNWTSVGNEVLKFQAASMFHPSEEIHSPRDFGLFDNISAAAIFMMSWIDTPKLSPREFRVPKIRLLLLTGRERREFDTLVTAATTTTTCRAAGTLHPYCNSDVPIAFVTAFHQYSKHTQNFLGRLSDLGDK